MDAPPPAKQKRALTREGFDRLLAWLDPDREGAGLKYEKIRSALTNRFRRLNCADPEERANETIDRVCQTLPKVIANYKGDPEPYFYAVAYYVYLEYMKLPASGPLPETDLPNGGASSTPHPVDDDSQDEALDECLSHCLKRLDKDERDLILEYYGGERHEKIRRRKELAERMGATPPYLRVLARRIRVRLKQCILDCLKGKTQA